MPALEVKVSPKLPADGASGDAQDSKDFSQNQEDDLTTCTMHNFTCRFDNARLEATFGQHYFENHYKQVAKALLYATIIWGAFLINDFDKNSKGLRKRFALTVIIRGVDCVIGVICSLLLWFRKVSTWKSMAAVVGCGMLAFGVSQILFGIWEENTLDPTYSIIMILIPSLSSTMFSQGFVFSLFFNWTLLILFILLTGLSSSFNSSGDFALTAAGVTMANVLFAVHSYNRERTIRRTFIVGCMLKNEEEKSQRLLARMLPQSIITKLKAGSEFIYMKHMSVSALFSHIHDFDEHTAHMKPLDVVYLLNELFGRFDEVTDQHGVYKVETIGDVYLVSAGCPEEYDRPDHTQIIAVVALAMMNCMKDFPVVASRHIHIRIGIHTGQVIAGVVGLKYPRYRLMGDTVNTASRMSTTCDNGDIQLSEPAYQALGSDFDAEYRGEIPVKGKGLMRVYLLKGHKYDWRVANIRAQDALRLRQQQQQQQQQKQQQQLQQQGGGLSVVVSRTPVASAAASSNPRSQTGSGIGPVSPRSLNVVAASDPTPAPSPPLLMIEGTASNHPEGNERGGITTTTTVEMIPPGSPVTAADDGLSAIIQQNVAKMTEHMPANVPKFKLRLEGEGPQQAETPVQMEKPRSRMSGTSSRRPSQMLHLSATTATTAKEFTSNFGHQTSLESILNRPRKWYDQLSLAFADRALEREFQATYALQRHEHQRPLVLLSSLALLGLSIYDNLNALDQRTNQAICWAFRSAGVVFGLLSYVLLGTQFCSAIRRPQMKQWLVCLTLVFQACMLISVQLIMQTYKKAYGVGCVLLVLSFASMFFDLQHVPAVLASIVVLAYYIIGGYTIRNNVPAVIFLLLAAAIMYTRSAYNTESYARQDYIRLRQQKSEKDRTKQFLDSMLPSVVLNELTQGGLVAHESERVDVLFSDIVSFTTICSAISPEDVVAMLNVMFSVFDSLTTQHQVYKVETIGDAYVACCGFVYKQANHSQSLLDCALAMQEHTSYMRTVKGDPLVIRIGIHTGYCIAGVVGRKMPRYHLFGETVTVAEELEARGVPGKVVISEATVASLRENKNDHEYSLIPLEPLSWGGGDKLIGRYMALRAASTTETSPLSNAAEDGQQPPQT